MIIFDILGIFTLWPVMRNAYFKTNYEKFNKDKANSERNNNGNTKSKPSI